MICGENGVPETAHETRNGSLKQTTRPTAVQSKLMEVAMLDVMLDASKKSAECGNGRMVGWDASIRCLSKEEMVDENGAL